MNVYISESIPGARKVLVQANIFEISNDGKTKFWR